MTVTIQFTNKNVLHIWNVAQITRLDKSKFRFVCDDASLRYYYNNVESISIKL